MKIRLILMGCIIIVLGVILLVSKGFALPLIALPIIGIVSAVVGVVWKPRKKADNPQ
jgi:tetrahydromethanopterin S-methyltransferase subunit C